MVKAKGTVTARETYFAIFVTLVKEVNNVYK